MYAVLYSHKRFCTKRNNNIIQFSEIDVDLNLIEY